MLVLILVAVQAWKLLGFSTAVQASTQGAVNFGTIFLIGLVAATSSCLALVGGLLLSVSATWLEHTQGETHWHRLQPLLLFNAGRLAGYFVLGGVIGMIGSALSIGTHLTGFLTIALSIVMIALALNILHILPKEYCRIPLPARLQKKIRTLTDSHHPMTPVILGALTFFIPCGFTQSMQLLALGSGSFLGGAAIMFVFALGTLPTLVGISVLGSYADGKFGRFFLTFSGCAVLLLGLANFNSGLLLTGVDAQGFIERTLHISQAHPVGNDPYVSIDAQGRQILAIYVQPGTYNPTRFTVEANRETWIYAIAQTPPQGCGAFMLVPAYNLSGPIQMGTSWLGPFIPTHDFVITCSAGIYRADVTVK